MRNYFAYIRVSTTKQGEKGVSLQEQRDAINRHASRESLNIIEWFEELETAAKQGRPVFTSMLKKLRQAQADGVIIHKIDRSARNLEDWLDIGRLVDAGIDVHFANESIDLTTRGGRLSADIQAVVAADYIRNLREETRKGFYGRLKQGFYPLPAPVGYLDRGKAKPKEIDPIKGPLVRKAFVLYGTAQFNLEKLADDLCRFGLRSRTGGPISTGGLSTILNNPFYIGLIRIARTGELFEGNHAPLISKSLFDRVQSILSGKYNTWNRRHSFLFRRLLTCKSCGYSLTGERQKGHVYYRCHSKNCPPTSVREESIELEVRKMFVPLLFTDDEKKYFAWRIAVLKGERIKREGEERGSLNMALGKISERLNRLTDAFLDGIVDKVLFEEKKAVLLMERKNVEEAVSGLKPSNGGIARKLEKFFELAGAASLTYENGLPEEKRDLLRLITSNRLVDGKNLDLRLLNPFEQVAKRSKTSDGGPCRDIPRTCDRLLDSLTKLEEAGKLPEFSVSPGGQYRSVDLESVPHKRKCSPHVLNRPKVRFAPVTDCPRASQSNAGGWKEDDTSDEIEVKE